MLQVNIVKVLEGPQDEEPFESDGGTIYKQIWLCRTEVDGKKEDAKITLGSKSAGGSPNAKYIRDGSMIAAQKRGEYKGLAQFYVDINATKFLHGDAYHQDRGKPQSQGKGKPSHDEKSPSKGQQSNFNDDRNRSFAAAYAKDLICAWEISKDLTEVLEHWQRTADYIWVWLEAKGNEAFDSAPANPPAPDEEKEDITCAPELPEQEPFESVDVDVNELIALLKKAECYNEAVRNMYGKHALIAEWEKAGNAKTFIQTVRNKTDNLPF